MNIKNLIKIVVSTVLLFFGILFLALGLDLVWFAALGLILAPVLAFLLNKKLNIKSKKLFISLGIFFVLSFVFGMANAKPQEDINTTAASPKEISSVKEEINNNENIVKTEEENKEDKVDAKVESKEEAKKTTEAKIHFINTGNSDSILITQGDKSLLIDGGDNDDEGLVSDYVKSKGVKKLSYMIATHPHADHIGGLDRVINNVGVSKLLVANGSADTKTYRDFINAAANKGVSPSVPLEGAKFPMGDNSYIQIFNTNGGEDANNESLVTLFVNGNDKVLLTGDAEASTESEILNNIPKVDLLKVGHHGSRTSTSNQFLDKASPKYAVLTVGKDNKYGHPHKETMDKLKNKNIEVHRTDECGTVIFTSTGKGVKTDCSKGSYTPGNNTSKSTTVSKSSGTTSSKSSSSSSSTTKKTTTSNKATSSTGNKTTSGSGEFIITETGNRYHRAGCSTIKQVKAKVSRAEAEKQGYTPCGRCHP